MKFNKFSVTIICLVLLCSIGIVCAHDSSQSINTNNCSNLSNIPLMNGVDKNVNCGTLLVHVFDDNGIKWDYPLKGAYVSLYNEDMGKLIEEGYTNEKEQFCLILLICLNIIVW